MKKITIILSLFALVLTSCSGSDGRDGLDGLDGDAIVGQTVEYDVNYDYTSNGNLWSSLLDFSDLEVFPGDAVLAYLQETVPADGGGTVNAWSQLPLTKFTPNGTLQYSFNHTQSDAELLITGNYNLINLGNSFTTNRVVRLVIVPSDIVAEFNGDFANIQEVMSALELNESDVKKTDLIIY